MIRAKKGRFFYFPIFGRISFSRYFGTQAKSFDEPIPPPRDQNSDTDRRESNSSFRCELETLPFFQTGLQETAMLIRKPSVGLDDFQDIENFRTQSATLGTHADAGAPARGRGHNELCMPIEPSINRSNTSNDYHLYQWGPKSVFITSG